MRVLRDAHGTPPLPIRNRSSRSLPEPGCHRCTSQVHARTGMGETMRVNYRRTTYILASALFAGALLAGCGAGADDSTSSSAGSAADKAAAPQRAEGGAAPAEQEP